MKRLFYFDNFASDRWPPLSELERFFLAPKGQEWSFAGGNDSWGMDVQGLCGTDGLPGEEQANVHFYMTVIGILESIYNTLNGTVASTQTDI